MPVSQFPVIKYSTLFCVIFYSISVQYSQYSVYSPLCLILDVPNSGRGEKTDKDPKGYPPKVSNGERQMFDEFLRGHVKTLEKTNTEIGNLIFIILLYTASQTKLSVLSSCIFLLSIF